MSGSANKTKQLDDVREIQFKTEDQLPEEEDFTRYREPYRLRVKLNVILAVLLCMSMAGNVLLHYLSLNPFGNGHRSLIVGIDTRGGVHDINMHENDRQ